VIAITHKLDLLDMFEYVLIVDKGRIIEEGPRSVILSKYI
jgi:ABC-type bacteriocin/lantibiotic exporter with double-glycine peptidase domain